MNNEDKARDVITVGYGLIEEEDKLIQITENGLIRAITAALDEKDGEITDLKAKLNLTVEALEAITTCNACTKGAKSYEQVPKHLMARIEDAKQTLTRIRGG